MKARKVVWTDESLHDLEAIYDFIAVHSPSSAKKIINSILSRTRQLETFAQSGSPLVVKPYREREYRYLVEGYYKIVYSLGDSYVYIEAVLDTRQNPDT